MAKKLLKCPFFGQKSFVTTDVTTTCWLRFGQKSAQIGQLSENPKRSFFRVRRQKWCLSLQIRSVDVRRMSPLCHRLLLGRESAQKAAQFPEDFVLRRVFRGPTARRGPGLERGSPPRFRPAARQPAELVTTDVTAPSGSVFGAKSAQNGQLRKVRFSCQTASEPQVSLVFGRKQAPDALCSGFRFQPGKQANSIPPRLSPLRHRSLLGRKVRKSGQVPKRILRWQV